MKQTIDEAMTIEAEKSLTLSDRTIGKSLAVLLVFLIIPLVGLTCFQLMSTRTGVTYENTLLFFWGGFVYFSATWHLLPTRYWEIVVYSMIICLASILVYIFQNNINISNGGAEISLLLYSPWIQISLISIVYFPIKYGFDTSVRERPLQDDEEGFYSQVTILRYLQIHYDLPSFRPRAVLLGVFTTVFALLVVFNGMWNWLATVRIAV